MVPIDPQKLHLGTTPAPPPPPGGQLSTMVVDMVPIDPVPPRWIPTYTLATAMGPT